MKLTWKKSDPFLLADDKQIECWSKVRNELNGLRPRNPLRPGTTDVYYATGNIPAMPRTFPVGEWKITGVNAHTDPAYDNGYLYPFFICTDAKSSVPEYVLDKNGLYVKATGRVIIDSDLGLHFSTSDWTQGCIRIKLEPDLRWLVANIKIGDPFTVTD